LEEGHLLLGEGGQKDGALETELEGHTEDHVFIDLEKTVAPVNPQFGQGIGAAGYTLSAKTGQILSGPCGYICHSVLYPQFPQKYLHQGEAVPQSADPEDHHCGTLSGIFSINEFENSILKYKLIVLYFAMLSKDKLPQLFPNFSFERGDLQAVCLLRQG
jgi:hypothetical protein